MNTTQKLIMYAVLSLGMFFLAREVAFETRYKEQAERAANNELVARIEAASGRNQRLLYERGVGPVDYDAAHGKARDAGLVAAAVVWLIAIPALASRKLAE